MKGLYWIKIWDNRIRYDIEIRRKITVIKGDSGTGKSTFVDMIVSYLTAKSRGRSVGIKLSTNIKHIVVLTELDNWRSILDNSSETLFIADEGVSYIKSRAFSGVFNASNCGLLCITRENRKFGCLTYAIDSVYGFKSEKVGKYYQTTLYNLYSDNHENFMADEIITEDSGSGLSVLSNIFNVPVVSTNGNDRIVGYVRNQLLNDRYKKLYIILDGAAYGGKIEALAKYLIYQNINIFAPESFEYLVLNTVLFRAYCNSELEHTEDYADFGKYLTWEQYYTNLLSELMYKLFGIEYNKGGESWVLKRKDLLEGVSEQIPDISQDLKNY